VTVTGKRAKVKGERFSASVPLDIGKNGIRVAAVAPSFARVQELRRSVGRRFRSKRSTKQPQAHPRPADQKKKRLHRAARKPA